MDREIDTAEERKETFGDRIRRFRTAAGLSQVELAALLYVSKNAVGNWEANRARPDLAKVPELCRLLRIPLSAFFGLPPENGGLSGEARRLLQGYQALDDRNRATVSGMISLLLELQEGERTPVRLDNLCRVYINSERASAGTGHVLSDADGEYVYIHLPHGSRKADEIITVTGDSMAPTFADGDRLLVEHTQQLSEGETGIFVINGQGYVKEYRADGLHSHNPAYDTIRLTENDDVRCVGRVLGIVPENAFANETETELMEKRRRSRRPMRE